MKIVLMCVGKWFLYAEAEEVYSVNRPMNFSGASVSLGSSLQNTTSISREAWWDPSSAAYRWRPWGSQSHSTLPRSAAKRCRWPSPRIASNPTRTCTKASQKRSWWGCATWRLDTRRYPKKVFQLCIFAFIAKQIIWLVVWTPLKNMKVNWDEDSQYFWENKIEGNQTTNQSWSFHYYALRCPHFHRGIHPVSSLGLL